MANLDETNIQQPQRRFDSTHWSLIKQAAHRSSPEGRIAFSQLCQRYWYPLYAHVRSLGYDVHAAQDLTQGFFQRVMEKNYVADADPQRGKFRTFLLTSLRNFIANEHDMKTAIKRGGNRVHQSFEFESAERRYKIEPTIEGTAEIQFERRWTRSLLDHVLSELQAESEASGKSALFEELKQFIVAGDSERIGSVAKRLSMQETAVRVAIHRLRTRYRKMLREEIATTLGDPAEVDDEIALLFENFRRSASH